MNKTMTKAELAGSSALPNTAGAVDKLLSEADAAAQAKAAIEAALVRFEGYGERAANGVGVVTAMALDFAAMCRDGLAKQADAEKLYGGYALGFNRAKRDDMDAMEPKGYAQSLSIFATFGLEYAVACGALGFYQEVADVRGKADKANVIGSAYNCYARFNRALSDAVKKDGAQSVVTMLADADKRRAFIEAVVLKDATVAKDEFAKAVKLADAIAALAKKSAHALESDWAELAKVVADRAAFLKLRSEARARENAALLIKKAA